jgi:hypothetical protein
MSQPWGSLVSTIVSLVASNDTTLPDRGTPTAKAASLWALPGGVEMTEDASTPIAEYFEGSTSSSKAFSGRPVPWCNTSTTSQ